MKYTFLHKSFSITMAFLVMLSTLSFTVEKHYCGNTLVDAALFTKAKGCGMEMPVLTKKSCCKEELDIVKGQDELKFSFNDFNLDQQQFIATFFYSYIDLFEGLPEQIIPFKEYSPPNLFYDRQLLHDVFII